MNKIFILVAVLFFVAIPVQAETTETTESFNAPPIYHTEEPDDEDEEWIEESLDTYGNPVKDFEYRDQWDKQSQKIQEQASLPFGQAGKSSAKKEAPAPKVSPSPSPSSTPEAAPIPQSRVLVS